MEINKYSQIVAVIKKKLLEYGLRPDAEALSESYYYKVLPDGIFQNQLRLANHAPTVQRMFGKRQTYFPSNDKYGNITLYIHDHKIVDKNRFIENSNNVLIKPKDYKDPIRRKTNISSAKFQEIKEKYSQDISGNIVFPYKMYLFDSLKFFDEKDELIHTDVLNDIADSCYEQYKAAGKKMLIVPESAVFAFMQQIDCIGVIKRHPLNEFRTTSRYLEFLIGHLVLNNNEPLDVLLKVKDLPDFLLKEFISQYGYPVSNNFISRKTVEVDTASMDASELLRKYFIEAGFPEGDIAVRQNENGIMLDIRDNTSLMLFIQIMSQKEHISYMEVRKKYGI